MSQRYLLASLVLCALPVLPQAADGNLAGVVLDPVGAAVLGAQVELRNPTTNVIHVTETAADGSYRFHNILAGQYDITATLPGFEPVRVAGVLVELNRTSSVNLVLTVAGVATAVDVAEAAAPIDTVSAQVSSSYNNRYARDLPLGANVIGANNYGVLNLSLLSAGVTTPGGIGSGVGPSVGGQRPYNNNFTIDGIDNNRRDTTGPISYISNEAVSAFTLIQNVAAPEFGHSSGAVFNTTVRSGTNAFHGSAYDYMTNRHLNALDAAFKRQGISERQRLDQNRFGATLGGPIRKDRLFFFGNFERLGYGEASTVSSAAYTPTEAGFAQLERIPGLNANNLGVFRQYAPAAASATKNVTVAGQAIPVGILRLSSPVYQNAYNSIASVDWEASERNRVRARFIGNQRRAIDASSSLPAFFGDNPSNAYNTNVTWFRTFSPSVFNELRGGYSRYFNDTRAGDFSYPGLGMFPNIVLAQDLNLQLGPNPFAPQSASINTYSLVNNTTWSLGRHTLRFGYDGRRVIAPQLFVQRLRGDYQYSTLDRYLRDLTPDMSALRAFGSSTFWGNLWSHYLFVNDEFRLRPNLTLNLGLRYEFVGVPDASKSQALNEVASVPGLIQFREPRAQRANWGPRVGLVWSPGQSGRTAIRAGFGVAQDQVFQNLGLLTLPPQYYTVADARVDPTNDVSGFLANGGIRPPSTSSSLPAAAARARTAAYVPDQVRPYSLNWTLGVQRTLARDYTVEVRYLGTRGVSLPIQLQLNRGTVVSPTNSLPTYLARPAQSELDALTLTLPALQSQVDPISSAFRSAGFGPPITAFMPFGGSTYHGLATQVTRRMARSLQFTAGYTWSHNIDNGTVPIASSILIPRRPQDFSNLAAERSSSALDRRQRLSVGWVYDTPWLQRHPNWFLRNLLGNYTFSGAYIAESPAYGVVQSGRDSNLNGDAAGDRAIVNPAGSALRGSSVSELRNSAGAVVGYLANDPTARYISAGPGTYPNAGRMTLPLAGINNFDLSFLKSIQLREATRVQFRADFSNAFNHSQYIPGSINTVAAVPRVQTRNYLTPGHPDFGRVDTAYQNNARTIQLLLRFEF